MALPTYILERVQNFQWSPDRGKVSGRMYGGAAHAELDGAEGTIRIDLQLWFHGGDNETTESLLPELCVRGMTYAGKYYDTYWHCIVATDAIYLHPRGWFGFSPANEKLRVLADSVRCGNPNLGQANIGPNTDRELIAAGFIRIYPAQNWMSDILAD